MAEDAVRWRPWGDKAFAQARAEGKRVLLSISASWCHWCHVMDGESFAHPEVIRRLNARFVPVRVDSDQRPDLNSRYNMGGWPTVAVLDADGNVIAGETYLPPGQFLAWLDSASQTSSPRPHRTAAPREAPAPPVLDHALVLTVAEQLERVYDRTFGGLGSAPKFPAPWAVELLLLLHARTGDAKWQVMATRTLDAMREGELCDLIDGGFFRYATGDDWSAPHTEKLLDVNARLLSIYLNAHRATGSISYRSTAQAVLDYLFSSLAVEGPAAGALWFAGSQAADHDYYELDQEERLEAQAPSIDRTLYVDRNAMAVSALIEAGEIFQKPDYREHGLSLLESLWAHGQSPDGGLAHYCDGGGDGRRMTGGYLADQVWLLRALLDACEAAGHRPWLERACATASVMDARWGDDRAGGFWDLPTGPNEPDRPDQSDRSGRKSATGLLAIRLKPLEENAVAAIGLTRLARLTGEPRYRRQAGRTLQALAPTIAGYKQHAASFGVALERFLASGAFEPLEQGPTRLPTRLDDRS